jgi:hypothetical protein
MINTLYAFSVMRTCHPDPDDVVFKQGRTKNTPQGNYMVNEGAKVSKLITIPNIHALYHTF